MMLAESGGFDGNPSETGVRLGFDDNLHILPKRTRKSIRRSTEKSSSL